MNIWEPTQDDTTDLRKHKYNYNTVLNFYAFSAESFNAYTLNATEKYLNHQMEHLNIIIEYISTFDYILVSVQTSSPQEINISKLWL